jgi:hypothetical protein
MENRDLSLPSAECLTTKKHTGAIQRRFDASVEFNASGDSAESTSRSFERPCYAQSNSDVHVEFTPWRMSQSQFRYRGQPNVIDLGEL